MQSNPNKHNGVKYPGDTVNKGPERLTKLQKKERKKRKRRQWGKGGKSLKWYLYTTVFVSPQFAFLSYPNIDQTNNIFCFCFLVINFMYYLFLV